MAALGVILLLISGCFAEKLWWTWEDGEDKAGRCGPAAPKLPSGKEPICNPDEAQYACCSEWGYCNPCPTGTLCYIQLLLQKHFLKLSV